ncbi:MAG: glycosyl transferase [bacterium]|nr:MAG: glycosyl transferase [bacterium]
MGDFYQTGVVATLHRLNKESYVNLENDLIEISQKRGITLILPSLYTEIHGEALKIIVNELKKVEYLNQIVVTMGSASSEQFLEMKRFFSILPQPTILIWNSGPRIQALYDELESARLHPGPDGKGRSAWMAYGYVIAEGKSNVIALHDCDILTYSREMLARLIYPVASINLDYEFCKGYYSRVTTRMHGRVTRLFVTPLIRSLMRLIGHLDILKYYDSFRYPLAGEFSMLTDLASIIRIPSDWGLEVGVLAEIYRNCSIKRICQAELCDNYEHKHQALSPEDPEKGLHKMVIDIAKSIFRTLAAEGIVFSNSFFNTLRAAYLREALDTISRYHGDALINNLEYDRHAEGTAVEMFTNAIGKVGEIILNDPLGPPLIPAWYRVSAAIPDFMPRLLNAVREDND